MSGKEQIRIFLGLLLLSASLAHAVDFTPQGNINLRNTYNIINWNISSCPSGYAAQGFYANGSFICVAASGGVSSGSQWNIVGSNYLINNSGILEINETKLNSTINNIDSNCNSSGGCVGGGVAYLDYANSGNFNSTGNIFATNFNATNDICITGGNCLSDAGVGSGDITAVTTTASNYLLGGSASGDVNLNFNETLLNLTIDARDTNTQLNEAQVESMIFDSDNTGNLETSGNVTAFSANVGRVQFGNGNYITNSSTSTKFVGTAFLVRNSADSYYGDLYSANHYNYGTTQLYALRVGIASGFRDAILLNAANNSLSLLNESNNGPGILRIGNNGPNITADGTDLIIDAPYVQLIGVNASDELIALNVTAKNNFIAGSGAQTFSLHDNGTAVLFDSANNPLTFVDLASFTTHVIMKEDVNISGNTRIGVASCTEALETDNSGLISCGTDDDTTYTAGNGLQLSSTEFSIDAQTCVAGNYSYWNGTSWLCSPDLQSAGGPSSGNPFDQDLNTSSSPTFVDLSLGQYLYHAGDADTFLRYSPDRAYFQIGGYEMFEMVQSVTDYVVFNQQQQDIDWRVETTQGQYSLYVDGGTGNVGINTDSPAEQFHVSGDSKFTGNLNVTNNVTIDELLSCDAVATDSNGRLICGSSTSVVSFDQDLNTTSNVTFNNVNISSRILNYANSGSYIESQSDGYGFDIYSNGRYLLDLGTGGGLLTTIFNPGLNNYDFSIYGDTDSNLFRVDASEDRIGIGTNSPASKLHVNGAIRSTDWSNVTIMESQISDLTHFSGSWGDLTGIPAGFDDDVDNDTQLTEDQVEAFIFDADNTGTLSSGTLALSSLSYTGTLGDSEIANNISISNAGSVHWGALNNYPTACSANRTITSIGDSITCTDISILESQISDLNHYTDSDIDGSEAAFDGWDKNASDDFDGSWNSLSNVPVGFADGVDNDTQLSESQVEGFVFDADNTGNLVTTGNLTASKYTINNFINFTTQGIVMYYPNGCRLISNSTGNYEIC